MRDLSTQIHRPRMTAVPRAWMLSIVIGAATAAAHGQAAFRAAFVANNGNLEGSVTSYRIHDDGTPEVVDRLITGWTPSSQTFHPGTNAYSMSLSPNGRFLAVGHATSSQTVEQLTLIEVAPDGTLSVFATYLVPDSPLGMSWITDEYLAVLRTNLSATNHVRVYRFDPAIPQFGFVQERATGAFSTSIVVSPDRQALYVNDSTGYQVSSFTVNGDGTLNPAGVAFTGPTYPLGLGINRTGTRLYGGGGISNSGNKVVGLDIDPVTRTATLMSGSPFLSPGASPKLAITSGDDRFLFVAHGTDATCRVMSIDNPAGTPIDTGFMFDVGFQGTLGDMRVLDDLLLITDNSTIFDGVKGLYSFTIQSDGRLAQNGPIVDSEGIGPQAIAAWTPLAVPGDVDGDGVVNFADVLALLAAWGPCPKTPAPCPEDLSGNGDVGLDDLLIVLANWTE